MKRCVVIILFIIALAARADMKGDKSCTHPARLANGIAVEGTIKVASEQGLVIQTSKGIMTYPWPHLSAGTRYRYQRTLSSSSADVSSDATGQPATNTSGTNVTSKTEQKPDAEKQTAK